MARTCRFAFAGRTGAAEWSFDGAVVTVTPEDGSPFSLPVKEFTGISGDGYTVRMGLPGAARGAAPAAEAAGVAGTPAQAAEGPAVTGAFAELSMLGHDGPTLLESLRREWIEARVEVLRLAGSGEGRPVSGVTTAGSGVAEPFHGLLFEDVLVVAREGRDLEPLFLALFEKVRFDEATYTVHVREWPGRDIVFSKLAKATDDFVRRLRDNRAVLAAEATATLGAALPALAGGLRSALAGTWMPGRLMQPAAMDGLCPGFGAAFAQGWLPGVLRKEEGAHLIAWAGPESTWLACSREEDGTAVGPTDDAGAESPPPRPLWMLAGKKGRWFLEALSMEDRATYCFAGGEEVPALVSRLLCAPQFSKEALYAPVGDLVGDKADLAIAAQHLGFLVELRSRFRGRVIHKSFAGWRTEMETLAQTAG